MAYIIGALLDVSASMKDAIGDGVNEEGGTWAHSIFRVMDDLIQYDVSESNRIFAAGFGANHISRDTFDIITTIMKVSETKENDSVEDDVSFVNQNCPAFDHTINGIFMILEQNGADLITKWTNVNTVSSVVTEYEARLLLNKLMNDRSFTVEFVNDLPAACKTLSTNPAVSYFQSFATSVVSTFHQASPEEISQIVKKATEQIRVQNTAYHLLKRISVQSVYNVKEVSNVLHGKIEEKDLTNQRVRGLLKLVEPYIYGGTPLHSALNEASILFQGIGPVYKSHGRLLFVLSDGDASDYDDLENIKARFEEENVKIVACYISKSSNVEARKLHSVSKSNWEEGAKFLFNLSSFIPTSLVTRAVFMKNKWQIDITNNETKLFMHVNHPDNLKDACNLARNAVCFQDSLSELLVSVSLDIYINNKNRSVKVYDQGDGNTCYAHASATVVHLAMHRIFGRNQGYPTFEALRDEMIDMYGTDGTNTYNALTQFCPKYRLHCKEVDIHGAMKAITEKRPVVAGFWLTEKEWRTFYDFFERSHNGILKKRDLDLSKRSGTEKKIGHAVVLTSFNSKCLQLMNSLGDRWADNGFFKVENADVLKMKFIDVSWNESELTHSEKASYTRHGAEVADTLMRSLKALQVASFICPECQGESNVDEFSGTLTRVYCPKCRREFSSSDGKGNLLALNIYLTTLSR